MKKFLFALLASASVLAMTAVSYAGTVITAPIDSRPISCEYLQNLAAVGGDNCIIVDKENLDFFSNDLSASRFGNSEKVREEMYSLVSSNNKRSTTVIINSSSYVTNGLVGSRCGKNYADRNTAMEDLKTLLTDNPEPTYYFNLSMPRSLPETRFNTIWRENGSPDLQGIGWFYLQHNPDVSDRDYIKSHYSKVNPSQFLLEYGYVENKANELGADALTPWESDFLNYFKNNFLNKMPYKAYITDYQEPYKAVADMFSCLLEMQKEGLLDEIIVSSDDLQLPDSVKYFSGKNEIWIQKEKGTPVKYSFPRKMLAIDYNSIYSQYDRAYGSRERSNGMVGRAGKINFISGMDEVPQLIYARSLSEKEKLSADLNIITSGTSRAAGVFDVSGIGSLAECAKNFTSASNTKTDRVFDLYIYNYNKAPDASSMLLEMRKNYEKGHNIGLIEILKIGRKNDVLQTILSDTAGYLNLEQLASYSAWNTNGNAIGLGIAHSQVFAISEQAHHNPSVIADAQIKMLAQHIYEDGIYTAYGKLALTNEGYRPSTDERYSSEKLYALLNDGTVDFKKKVYRVGDSKFDIKKVEMTACGFPWVRLFDCCLDFNVITEKR